VLAGLPSVRDQFRHARATLPFVHMPRLAFRSAIVCGRRWALLPSAAGVIDPLLSTGFPLTLLGILRLLEILEDDLDTPGREMRLRDYAAATQAELDATERLVAALYATMADPALFKRLTLLYFAAASYAETAWRLNRRELAPGFLLHAHPQFGPELRACSERACGSLGQDARKALLARIDRAIEPFDIAGLGDRTRGDWYPVLAGDLMRNAGKVQAAPADIEQLLERCGFRTT
jgi:FADH2 O2-dependent halogenase